MLVYLWRVVMAEWRTVTDWDGFEVSNEGHVRSLDRWSVRSDGVRRRLKGRMLRPFRNRNGHLYVTLETNGRRWRVGVHQLVCREWHGPPPDDALACHVDGEPSNNRPANLRWGTQRDNMADRKRHGRDRRSTDAQVLEALALRRQGLAYKVIGERVGMDASWARLVCVGELHGDVGDREGLPSRVAPSERPFRAPAGKLTEADVRGMRAERKAGAHLRTLAERYGVSVATASMVCRRKVWKHVD
jgi:hypothetical protein